MESQTLFGHTEEQAYVPVEPAAGKRNDVLMGGLYWVITFQPLTKTFVPLNGFELKLQISYCHAEKEVKSYTWVLNIRVGGNKRVGKKKLDKSIIV